MFHPCTCGLHRGATVVAATLIGYDDQWQSYMVGQVGYGTPQDFRKNPVSTVALLQAVMPTPSSLVAHSEIAL
jgi:hypothetical protein